MKRVPETPGAMLKKGTLFTASASLGYVSAMDAMNGPGQAPGLEHLHPFHIPVGGALNGFIEAYPVESTVTFGVVAVVTGVKLAVGMFRAVRSSV